MGCSQREITIDKSAIIGYAGGENGGINPC